LEKEKKRKHVSLLVSFVCYPFYVKLRKQASLWPLKDQEDKASLEVCEACFQYLLFLIPKTNYVKQKIQEGIRVFFLKTNEKIPTFQKPKHRTQKAYKNQQETQKFSILKEA